MDAHEAEQRTAKIGKLSALRIKGARAASLIDELQPVFDEVRAIYHRQMVENTKASGEPDTYSVWSLVALHDIETMLKEQAVRGNRAVDKLRKLENAGGSE